MNLQLEQQTLIKARIRQADFRVLRRVLDGADIFVALGGRKVSTFALLFPTGPGIRLTDLALLSGT
jgi:hypothetical protein